MMGKHGNNCCLFVFLNLWLFCSWSCNERLMNWVSWNTLPLFCPVLLNWFALVSCKSVKKKKKYRKVTSLELYSAAAACGIDYNISKETWWAVWGKCKPHFNNFLLILLIFLWRSTRLILFLVNQWRFFPHIYTLELLGTSTAYCWPLRGQPSQREEFVTTTKHYDWLWLLQYVQAGQSHLTFYSFIH